MVLTRTVSYPRVIYQHLIYLQNTKTRESLMTRDHCMLVVTDIDTVLRKTKTPERQT